MPTLAHCLHPSACARIATLSTLLGAVALSTLLSAAACVLAGCGGATDDSVAAPPSASAASPEWTHADGAGPRHVELALRLTGDPFTRIVVLDADAHGSVDALADGAALERGAPGEAEPVLYLVRSLRPADAVQRVDELQRRGFDKVLALTEPT